MKNKFKQKDWLNENIDGENRGSKNNIERYLILDLIKIRRYSIVTKIGAIFVMVNF